MIATGTRSKLLMRLSYDVAAHEVGVRLAPGQVDEVEDHEQGDDHARPPHRPRGEVGGHVVALRLVLHRPGLPVHPGQLRGGDDVEHERGDQADAHPPEQRRCGGARARRASRSHSAYSFEVIRAQVQLEVADHVGEHVAEQRDPAQGHDPLLADGRAPEAEQRVALLPGLRDRRPGVPGQPSASSAPPFCSAVETSTVPSPPRLFPSGSVPHRRLSRETYRSASAGHDTEPLEQIVVRVGHLAERSGCRSVSVTCRASSGGTSSPPM